jgi:hypothetical protein
MVELMTERARALNDAVTSGPPPLGPGAPDRDRLLAFLDAMVEVVSRNKSLLAELAHTGATDPTPAGQHGNGPGKPEEEHPVYWFWHGHISALISSQRPGADADTIAHILLGALHSEPVLAQLATEGPARPAAAIRALVTGITGG